MAVKTFIGNAHDVKQISTITVANTWAAGDTATMTINTKDIIVTCGSTTTTTATVAAALKEAWMSATRLDGTSASSNATSNAGGQEFGEFSEATASVSGSVVTIIANKAGKPFTLSVTEVTAGTGTATGATATASTGKNNWDNIDNWDTGAVPIDDDTVVFRDSNVSCLYGLPTVLEVTIQQWMSYTGEVGLPAINVDEPGKPYYEYRQRYVRLTDAGTGTNIQHRFGMGKDGAGCRLFNLKHSTVKCTPIVYNTASPLASRVGTKALNICCTENASTINVLNGSVDFSTQDGGTAAFATAYVNGGDARCVNGMKSAGVVVVSGGTALFGCDQSVTYTCRAGTTRIEGQSATVTLISIHEGATVDYASAATITAINMWGGTFDARNDAGAFTLTNITMFNPARLFDPYRRITFTNDMAVYFELSSTLLLGPSSLQPIKIGF